MSAWQFRGNERGLGWPTLCQFCVKLSVVVNGGKQLEMRHQVTPGSTFDRTLFDDMSYEIVRPKIPRPQDFRQLVLTNQRVWNYPVDTRFELNVGSSWARKSF